MPMEFFLSFSLHNIPAQLMKFKESHNRQTDRQIHAFMPEQEFKLRSYQALI